MEKYKIPSARDVAKAILVPPMPINMPTKQAEAELVTLEKTLKDRLIALKK